MRRRSVLQWVFAQAISERIAARRPLPHLPEQSTATVRGNLECSEPALLGGRTNAPSSGQGSLLDRERRHPAGSCHPSSASWGGPVDGRLTARGEGLVDLGKGAGTEEAAIGGEG